VLDRFVIEPCAVPCWAGENGMTALHPGCKDRVALGAMQFIDLALAEFLEQAPILVARPLILTSPFDVVQFVAESIFVVAHNRS